MQLPCIPPQAVIYLSEKRRSNSIIPPYSNSDNKFYPAPTLKGLQIRYFR